MLFPLFYTQSICEATSNYNFDWPDEERATCFDSTARQRRRLLYEIAAEDPVAITRIFYYTVRTVLVELGLILNELFHSSETLTLRAIFFRVERSPWYDDLQAK